jgi:flagellar biosynthesis protein FliP
MLRAVFGMAVALALAPAAVPLFAQQTAGTQNMAGLATAIQAAVNPSATATAPAAGATRLAIDVPQLPQITAPAMNRGARAAAPRAPQAAAARTQPAGPRAANTAGTANVATATAPATAPVAAPASMDTMLTKLAPQMDLRVGGKDDGGLRLSGTVGIIVMMGLLTLLPTLVLLMTGFTRILIVLNFLRQALGTQNAPPAQLVAALSLILTGFVMAPTLNKVNETALQPWMNGKMEQGEMMKTAVIPFREFMLKHTRDHDLQVFIDMSSGVAPRNEDEIPLVTLVSAFATSELRVAFQIGFALFLPFIIIDIVVASVLMSMGMFMLPPAMISLPFKLLLFVLVDGWTLVVQSLVTSFRV